MINIYGLVFHRKSLLLVIVFVVLSLSGCKDELYDPAKDPCNVELKTTGKLGIGFKSVNFTLYHMEDGVGEKNVISSEYSLPDYIALDSCVNIYQVRLSANFTDSPVESVRITSPTGITETKYDEYIYDPAHPIDYNTILVDFKLNGGLAWVLNGKWRVEILSGIATSVEVLIKFKVLQPESAIP